MGYLSDYSSIFSLYLHKTAIYFETYSVLRADNINAIFFFAFSMEPTDILSDFEHEAKKIPSLSSRWNFQVALLDLRR